MLIDFQDLSGTKCFCCKTKMLHTLFLLRIHCIKVYLYWAVEMVSDTVPVATVPSVTWFESRCLQNSSLIPLRNGLLVIV